MKLLDKLFGLPELQGKYVKYSDATARENPQMILNEYNNIINIKTYDLVDLDKNKYYIRLGVFENFTKERDYFGDGFVVRGIQKKLNIKVHASKVKELLKEYTDMKLKNDKIKEEIEAIELERDNFERDYKYSLMYSGR